MIKEFTPLLGYISWSSFQWIIFIICSKVLKQCFAMLIMKNRWLQWLHNVQKPLVGLFLHLVWPKIEENTLPRSFSPILVVSSLPKCTHCHSKSASVCFSVQNLAPQPHIVNVKLLHH
jgi:hypothetical protein